MGAVASRVVSIAVLPAQLPGDAHAAVDALARAPLAALAYAARAKLPCALCHALARKRKLELPSGTDDEQLRRLDQRREAAIGHGWLPLPVVTRDGVALSALHRPPSPYARGAPAYVLFVCGNMQKYEDWIPYFERYADDTGVGIAAFAFRGVGLSDGAPSVPGELVADLDAVVHALMAEVRLPPARLVLHGFSLGGAVAAAYLSAPDSPPSALVLDRTFRSLPDVARSLFGPGHGGDSDGGEASGGPSQVWQRLCEATGHWWKRLVASVAAGALHCSQWKLDTLSAARRLKGRVIVTFHVHDDVVDYTGASLHAALMSDEGGVEQANGKLAPREWVAVEVVECGGHGGLGTHDLPLCLDAAAWDAFCTALQWALEPSESSWPTEPGEPGQPS